MSVENIVKSPQKFIWHRLPVVNALLAQCVAGCGTLLLGIGVIKIGWSVPFIVFILAQGVLAAVASRWREQARWWLYIQFFFPISVYLTLRMQLPSGVFLAAFVCMVVVYWSTFRTRVPFYPSSPALWSTVIDQIPTDRPVTMIDIGSGLGGLVCRAAAMRPDSQFIGIEVAPLPWLVSRLRRQGNNCRFVRGDYNRLNFARYDVVFAYLSSAAMLSLWSKANAEMRHGAILLSYEFPIPGIDADFIVEPKTGHALLYGWRM
ncbi:MAG: class I SAM-dependent methyltransferase [Herbaspirillum sp.]